MWYQAWPESWDGEDVVAVACAESEDGLNWHRPDYGLVECGGSDYHAFGSEGEVAPGFSGPPPETPRLLLERARSLHGDRVGCVPAGMG